MHLLKRTPYLRQGKYRKSRVFVRPGTPGPLLGNFNFRPAYFLRLHLQMFIILFPVVKPKPNNNVEHYSLYVLFCTMFCRCMAKMHPGALKILKFSKEWPPTPPVEQGRPPSHTYPNLVLRAKMVAPPPYFVPAIATFVPATSNLNKNPGKSPI